MNKGANKMRIRDIVGDFIGAVSIFGIFYGAALMAYGFGG